MEPSSFAKLFDHSIVRPDASRAEVAHFADTAAKLGTATLTVQPHYIRFATEQLRGSGVLVGTVVGFPHGNETPSGKAYQAREVLDLGAEEIDMVMNIPALKNGEAELFMRDVEGVVRAAEGKTVKVITENCYLTQEEKRRCSLDVPGGQGEVPGESCRRDPGNPRSATVPPSWRAAVRLDPERPLRPRVSSLTR